MIIMLRAAARQGMPRLPIMTNNRCLAAVATVKKVDAPSVGGRFVVEEDQDGNALEDPILVAKMKDGSFYAIDSICPHMNKSMEKGKIIENTESGDPELQCPLHNTRFSMKTGVSTKWVTGALGYENKIVSGLAQKVGGEQRDVKAFRVVANEDGTLTIDDDLDATIT